MASNETLMSCGRLPDCLRNKRCIYAIDKFDNNLCVRSCLAIYKRNNIQRGTEFVTRTALNLAREYYGDKNLKRMKNIEKMKKQQQNEMKTQKWQQHHKNLLGGSPKQSTIAGSF